MVFASKSPILDATYQVLVGHNVEMLYNKLQTYQCGEGEFSYIVDLPCSNY